MESNKNIEKMWLKKALVGLDAERAPKVSYLILRARSTPVQNRPQIASKLGKTGVLFFET